MGTLQPLTACGYFTNRPRRRAAPARGLRGDRRCSDLLRRPTRTEPRTARAGTPPGRADPRSLKERAAPAGRCPGRGGAERSARPGRAAIRAASPGAPFLPHPLLLPLFAPSAGLGAFPRAPLAAAAAFVPSLRAEERAPASRDSRAAAVSLSADVAAWRRGGRWARGRPAADKGRRWTATGRTPPAGRQSGSAAVTWSAGPWPRSSWRSESGGVCPAAGP